MPWDIREVERYLGERPQRRRFDFKIVAIALVVLVLTGLAFVPALRSNPAEPPSPTPVVLSPTPDVGPEAQSPAP